MAGQSRLRYLNCAAAGAAAAALIAAATGCASGATGLQHSAELDELLPPASAFPDGLAVEAVPPDEFTPPASGLTGAEPEICAGLLGEVQDQAAPEGAEAAMQVGADEGGDRVLIYMLLRGGGAGAELDAATESMADCPSFSGRADGVAVDVELYPLAGGQIPRSDGGYLVVSSTEDYSAVGTTLWGAVEGVRFIAVEIRMEESRGAVPTFDPDCVEEAEPYGAAGTSTEGTAVEECMPAAGDEAPEVHRDFVADVAALVAATGEAQ